MGITEALLATRLILCLVSKRLTATAHHTHLYASFLYEDILKPISGLCACVRCPVCYACMYECRCMYILMLIYRGVHIKQEVHATIWSCLISVYYLPHCSLFDVANVYLIFMLFDIRLINGYHSETPIRLYFTQWSYNMNT